VPVSGIVTALASIVAVIGATAAADVGGGRHAGADAAITVAGAGRGHTGLGVPAMLPGQSVRRCVSVDAHQAEDGSELRVFGAATGDLTPHLLLTIRRGTAGSTCAVPGRLTVVFDGPLDGFGQDFVAASPGHPRSVHAVPYLVEVMLDESAPNSAQGMRADLDLLWEVNRGAPSH